MPIAFARKSRRSVSPSALLTGLPDGDKGALVPPAGTGEADNIQVSSSSLGRTSAGKGAGTLRDSMPIVSEHTEMAPAVAAATSVGKKNLNHRMIRRASSTCLLGEKSIDSNSSSIASAQSVQKQPQRPMRSCMSVPSLEESLHAYQKGKTNNENDQQQDTSPSEKVDKIKQTVSFHAIQVREYPMTLGDHPGAKNGPPVTLSWEYNPSHATVSVDDFETHRPPRRTRSQIYIPSRRREEMLNKEFGIGRDQIRKARKEVSKVREQRQKTVATLHNAPMEEAVEKARRKIRRFVRGTSERREQRRLWKEAKRITETTATIENSFTTEAKDSSFVPVRTAQKKTEDADAAKEQQVRCAVEQQVQGEAELQGRDYVGILRSNSNISVWAIDDTVDDEGPLAF